MTEPHIIPRSEHGISRASISANALKVLYRLKQGGYQAYLVGGGVRDLMLGREPKDFDIATDAHPEQVHELFKNCRLIGRRFRLAHVHFKGEIIEVATFRGGGEDEPGEVKDESGRLIHDNVYGTLEEDVWRRDFSVNALYYNIADFSVVDYANGAEDLKQGVLRMIGDPATRFQEDPVRMLRAVRFATKLGFRIDEAVEKAMFEQNHLLAEVPAARLFEELLKLFHSGYAVQAFEHLCHYGLFAHLFPWTEEVLAHEEEGFPITFVAKALTNTDKRINEGLPVTPAFLFAVLLWEPVRLRTRELVASGLSEYDALHQAGQELTRQQVERISIPKRFSIPMREIWTLQPRFEMRRGKRPMRLMAHPRFRAAYDFLVMRAQVGEAEQELADWWTEIQEVDEGERKQRTATAPGKKRRRRRRRKPRGSGGESKD